MTQPSPEMELHDRLAEALGGHDVHPEDRAAIQAAYVEAGMDEATWDDLPPDIQAKIVEIEQSPRQSWDDPFDVPDDPDAQS